jgi:protein gp37
MTKTNIEWTQHVWNPFAGCSVLSPGCTNCYAMKMAARIEACNAGLPSSHGGALHYAGTTKSVNGNPVWTGKIGIASDEVLLKPLRRKKPTTWFVNSMSDLFHENVPDEAIDRVFAVMALTPQHTYQVLTKRSARMRAYLSMARAHPVGMEALGIVLDEHAGRANATVGAGVIIEGDIAPLKVWPLPNVWLGVSTERQKEADERIPDLLATPAAIRFISAEPLLGPIDLEPWLPWPNDTYIGSKPWGCIQCDAPCDCPAGKAVYHETEGPLGADGVPEWITADRQTLDQVTIGGENGERPMHPDWARSLRDQCAAAGTAFFFKQWGSWYPIVDRDNEDPDWRADYGRASRAPEKFRILNLAGGCGFHGERVHLMQRYSKSATGRLLDGITHDGMPEGAR